MGDGALCCISRIVFWRFWKATRELMRKAWIRHSDLEIWLGHAIQMLRLQRSLMSALQAVYRALQGRRHGWIRVSWEVRRELKWVRDLSFFCGQDLGKPLSDLVHVSDSSDQGYALLYQRGPKKAIAEDCRWKERWRFWEVEPESEQPLLDGGLRGRSFWFVPSWWRDLSRHWCLCFFLHSRRQAVRSRQAHRFWRLAA